MANNTDYSRLLDGNALLAIKAWIEAKGYGTVKSIKVGNTSYSPSSGVVSLPAYPTTLPASDVYAWAKAATKPSYSFSEITTRGEAFLAWGGQNLSGSYAPIDAAMVPQLGSNRLAFMKAEKVYVEYSRDGGQTWTDYGSADSQKIQLFNGQTASFIIGKSSTSQVADSNCLLRINVYTASSVYTVLNKFVIYVSTSGSAGCWCTIRARTQNNYLNNVDTWTVFANKVPVSGWSGYNIINTSGITTYGNTTASQYGHIQFIFGETSHSSASYAGLTIQSILGYGGVGWTTPSNMARIGTIYSYDYAQNVTFPARVSATGFTEGGTALVDKYLGKSAKAADADKLDGNDSSYYLNYNNLNNKPTIPTVSNATITIKQTGLSDQTFTLNGSATTITLADTNTWRPLGTGANDACAGNDSRLSNARPASDVYAWAKAETKPSYTYSEVGAAAASHTHTKSQITDFPTSMPASDVYSWAKASTKPSYNYGEIGAGIVSNALIDVHPESSASTISYYTNDLVNLLVKGGTCTATNITRSTAVSTTISNWFDGTPTYGGFSVTAVTDVVEILISLPAGLSYSWGTHYGIGFGNAGWRAKDVKIESGYESNGSTIWKTVYNVTNSGQALHDSGSTGGPGTGGTPWNRIRITLTNFNNTSPRIAQIWTQNYGSKGLAYNFVQTGGSTMYGTLNMQHAYPRTSNTYDLGSSSYQWNNLYSKTIYENGTTLSNKYLGKSAKAADSDKLDGQDSAYYLNYNNLTNKPTIPTKSSWNYDDVYIKYSAAQTLTDAQKTQARSNIGAGTSSFTGYTSSNKLSTSYIQNDAGWTSVVESTVSGWGFTKNAGTVTSVDSVSPSSGNVALSAVRYVSQSLTDAQKTQARTNIGAGTSNFTGYTSSNKLSTDYINNVAGWTSNTGTITGVSVNGSSVATSGVANITSIPYSILTNPPTIPATNVIPATTSKHAMLLSTQTSGTAEWSSWSDAGVIASTTSGEVVLLSKGSTNQGKFLGISSNNALGWTSLPEANTTTAGIVTTDEQSFAGVKTFRLAPFIGYKKSGSTSGISGAINFVDGTTTYPYRTILRVTEGLTATSNIVYLPTGTGTLALVGDNNHSHTLSIASGGSSPTTLAANTTYTLTAGGSTLVFKTPSSGGSAYYANQYNYNYFLDSNSGAFLFSDPIEAQTTIVGLQGGNASIMAFGWPGLEADSSKRSLLLNGNRIDLVLTDSYQDYFKGLSIDMYDDDYYTLHIRANIYSDLSGSVIGDSGSYVELNAASFSVAPKEINSAVTVRKYVTLGVVMHNITYTHSGSVLLKINIRGSSANDSTITSYTSLCQLLYASGYRSANTCLTCSGRYSSYSYVVLGVYATAVNSGLYLVYCATSNNTVSTLAIANGTVSDTISVCLVP